MSIEAWACPYQIPDGWRIETLDGFRDRYWILTAPSIGAATIDFVERGYRFGYNTTFGRFPDEKITWCGRTRKRERPVYKGRGWRQKLVDAAVKALSELKP